MKDFPYFPVRGKDELQPAYGHQVYRFWKNYFQAKKRKFKSNTIALYIIFNTCSLISLVFANFHRFTVHTAGRPSSLSTYLQ